MWCDGRGGEGEVVMVVVKVGKRDLGDIESVGTIRWDRRWQAPTLAHHPPSPSLPSLLPPLTPHSLTPLPSPSLYMIINHPFFIASCSRIME